MRGAFASRAMSGTGRRSSGSSATARSIVCAARSVKRSFAAGPVIIIPKGVPAEVVATVEKLWAEKIATSEKIRAYATQRGALFTPLSGKAAYDAVWPTVVSDAFLLQDAGMAKVTPESIGIRR